MNPSTATLIDRPYLEVVDDILTAITGGVVNEPILFDVKEDLYALSRQSLDIRSINGTQARQHHTFLKGVDYVFSQGDNAVVWQQHGQQPDDETTFYVDYFLPNSLSPLTDINVGSVTRTLGEAIGREIATVYQEINAAYLSGFIDTATGQALDFVVSILNVVRLTKDFAIGLATFFRDAAASDGNITIPVGTLLTTDKGDAEFATTELRTLQRGQARIDIAIRATAKSKGPVGVVAGGAITTLEQPITGIAKVTNFDATVLGADNESDDDLRARAKSVLQSLDKATLAALARAVFEERATLTEVWDPNGPPGKNSDPGTVVLLVQASPERFLSLQSNVNETRAAGVLCTVVAKYVFFKPRMVVTVAGSSVATPAGKVKLTAQIIAAMQQYCDGLQAGQPAKAADLLNAIHQNVPEAKDPKSVRIVDAMAWHSDIGNPGAATFVDLLVQAVESVPAGNEPALRAALDDIVSNAAPGPPSERRIPDRGLVQGPSGQQATDVEIEAGTFQVSATVGNEGWTIRLDSEPADILLVSA